jgi:acetyl esterase/lipase
MQLGSGMAADRQAPTITVTQKPASVTNSTSATIAFRVTDNSGRVNRIACSRDGAAYSACTSPVVLSGLAAGSRKFSIQASDFSGNVRTTTITWTIDLTAPVVKITSTPAASTTSTSASFSFSGTDVGSAIARFDCSLDSAGFSTCRSPKSYSGLSVGSHAFAVRAVDSAGNISSSASYSWTVQASSSVPNSFISDSEIYSYATYSNLSYGSNSSQKLDLYIPMVSGQSSFPLLIYMHGGAWSEGDKSDPFMISWLSRMTKHGIATASLNYRLIPKTYAAGNIQLEDVVSDVKGALRWLKANSATYKLNPSYFFVFGESAGGHLSSLLATTVGMSQLEGSIGGNIDVVANIAGLVDFYGPVDLVDEDAFLKKYNPEDLAYLMPLVFGNCDPQTACKDRAYSLSSFNKASSDDPPALIVHGTADSLVPYSSQSVVLYNNLVASGVQARLILANGMDHDMALLTNYFGDVFQFMKNISQTAPAYSGPPALNSLALSPVNVTGGNAAQGVVSLTGAAPDGGITITLLSDSALAAVPSSITVPAGSSSATFAVSTSTVSISTQVNISAIYGGATKTATLTLVPKALSVLSTSGWSLKYVDSQELVGEDGAAVNAFDGNTVTFWHTAWYTSSPPPPHEIQVDMGAAYSVGGFRYLPRQDGGTNGFIGQYEFYLSQDGINWSLVASGTFANSAAQKEVLFTIAPARYVRLRALTEANGNPWTAVAELRVLALQ